MLNSESCSFWPTPQCLVVCDRCHESVGVMISQEPTFLSKDLTGFFMRFCLPMLNPCLRRLLKSSLALTTSLTSCNMPARRLSEVWFEVSGKGTFPKGLPDIIWVIFLWLRDLFCH